MSPPFEPPPPEAEARDVVVGAGVVIPGDEVGLGGGAGLHGPSKLMQCSPPNAAFTVPTEIAHWLVPHATGPFRLCTWMVARTTSGADGKEPSGPVANPASL